MSSRDQKWIGIFEKLFFHQQYVKSEENSMLGYLINETIFISSILKHNKNQYFKSEKISS